MGKYLPLAPLWPDLAHHDICISGPPTQSIRSCAFCNLADDLLFLIKGVKGPPGPPGRPGATGTAVWYPAIVI